MIFAHVQTASTAVTSVQTPSYRLQPSMQPFAEDSHPANIGTRQEGTTFEKSGVTRLACQGRKQFCW
jgi:hypothetical protein